MKTNLTEQQIIHGRAFMVDLRANEYKCTDQMRDGKGGRCCLCVAFDTAQRLGAGMEERHADLPPSEICAFYGWDDRNPWLGGLIASNWNDGGSCGLEKTHVEIADLFEEEFPQLKL